MTNYENKYVILRGDKSGIFAGIFKERCGTEVTLTDCRRLWFWDGAASISQLAVDGTSKPNDCNFTVSVNEITILDAIEIIPCTDKTETSIRGVKVWRV